MATGQTQNTLTLRLRLGQHDAHYGGNLVDGARILALFGDVATGLLIADSGDEGLFVAYESIEFLAPSYAGDFVEASGSIVRVGHRSRTMEFTAQKFIAARPERGPSAAEVLPKPILLCRAKGTCVIPA